MIHTSLSPNATLKDIFIAKSYIFFPWKWLSIRHGKHIHQIEEKFKKYLPIKHAVTFDSGRSALYAILKAMNIQKGDEIIIQAYTCVVVPNAIIHAGAVPIYADIEKDSLNIDPNDLEKKITPKTKAIIIQNTFGAVADYEKIQMITSKHKLKIIEDCAHSLGAEYKNKKIGTIGDAAMFSFGRDKVISAVYGGIATTNNPEISKNLKNFQQNLSFQSYKKIYSHLLHPIIFAISLPLYNFLHLGKIIILFFQKINLLSKALIQEEKKGEFPESQPACFPNALAEIACNQMKNLDKFNNHRQKIAEFYQQELSESNPRTPKLNKISKNIYLRYTIFISKRDELMRIAAKQHIYLGDWYDNVIAPKNVDFKSVFYQKGFCEHAEQRALESINLPTHIHITIKKAKKIVDFLKNN